MLPISLTLQNYGPPYTHLVSIIKFKGLGLPASGMGGGIQKIQMYWSRKSYKHSRNYLACCDVFILRKPRVMFIKSTECNAGLAKYPNNSILD
jgi:hypothetical protein